MPALWQCGQASHLGRSRNRTINVLFAELPPLLRCLPLIPRDGKKRVADMRSFNYYFFTLSSIIRDGRRQACVEMRGQCGRPISLGEKKTKTDGGVARTTSRP